MSAEYAWVAAFEAIPKGTGNLAADLPIGLLGRMTEWEVVRVTQRGATVCVGVCLWGCGGGVGW